ncbi:hypothetical protein R1flu_020793 [Riccia fluitans]|uniref:Reverse transcriptase n=1 Tax=Riccia fluitans TaxID=41844 RepID=A0ABD1ZMI4_9MARC
MCLLRKGENEGDLVGVTIPRGKTLLHRLFANNSGMAIRVEENNVKQLCQIVEKFEMTSGAQINPAKSVLVPFALEHSPSWLQETGCQILKPGQYSTYLGCRFGVEKIEEEQAQDLHRKLQGKLSKWANRMLSWASLMLLLQHVLRAIPVYHFLGLGLHNTNYRKLEAPCRVFLWGTNADNKAKKALVSWESVT